MRFTTRTALSVYLRWQLWVVVAKLRRRSSFVRTSRRSLTKVDLILEVDGQPTQGLITVACCDGALEIRLRPDGLVELAEVDKALVPDDPDGSWPTWVRPPITEAGVVTADTVDAEPLPLEQAS
jgi:hypothetical protein